MMLQDSCITDSGVKDLCKEKDVRNSTKFHSGFFSPLFLLFLFIFSPIIPFAENTVPCAALWGTQHVHGASRDRRTRGEEHSVTAGIPLSPQATPEHGMGLGRMEPEQTMLKPKVQGHEVLKTDYGWWNSGDHGRPDNRSLCLFEGKIYIVIQKKVEFN